MKTKSVVTLRGEKSGSPALPEKGMNRREMVRRLATAMTAAPALTVMSARPAAASAPSGGKPLNQAASQKDSNAGWRPAFFDAHQNETFAVLAERILPGSTEAQVSQFVDLLLSVNSLEVQKRFLNSLSAFEAYCLETYRHPFKDLSEDQQVHVLTVASTAKAGGALPGFGPRRILGPQAQEAGKEETLTLRDHFEFLKRWVSEAYFSSEAGMKSMGWTGQVMWDSFPGCTHSDGHS